MTAFPWGSWINWRKVQPERREDMVVRSMYFNDDGDDDENQ